jgi:integrase/recombinase XerC
MFNHNEPPASPPSPAMTDPAPKKKKRRRTLPKVLNQPDSDALASAAHAAIDVARTPGKKLAAHRDLVMLALGSMAGLRVSELCSLQVESLDLAGQMIAVIHGKGGKDRNVPMADALVPLLMAWLGPRISGYVFPGPGGRRLSERSFRRRLDTLAKAAGIIKHVHPHILRHTFATSYLETNGDNALRELQELLGHTMLSTTEHYLHVKPNRLKKGVNNLGKMAAFQSSRPKT